jgi:hypothetical protein
MATAASASGAPFASTWQEFILTDTPKLDPARIEMVGFPISDQQTGDFQLEVQRSKSVRRHAFGAVQLIM